MASSSTQKTLKILEQSHVSPPPGSVPSTTIPLTFFDIIWLFSGPVQRLFFYSFPHSTSHFINHHLPNLKTSLSLTLQSFFPLSGHVRQLGNEFELFYIDGDSVSFTVAESNSNFRTLSGHQPRSFKSLLSLSPALKTISGELIGGPLMAIQVTVFPNQGLCLGISIKHVACDGTSSMNFMKSWAATCRAGAGSLVLAVPPVYDRSMVVDPANLSSIYYNVSMEAAKAAAAAAAAETLTPASSKSISGNYEEDMDLVSATFTLRKDQLEKLKKMMGPKSSTFVVACAHAWTCLMRSRRQPEETTAYAGFAVDCRQRLEPPLPEGYFGNCVGAAFAEANTGEMTGEEGVRVAGKVLKKAVEELGGGVLRGADKWPEKVIEMLPKRPLSVAGSPKFKVYETDFGWGWPEKVEVVSLEQNGALSMAESGKEEGGIEIGLVLTKKEMEEFSLAFHDALKVLSFHKY
ncbi:Transferase protein [Dioscorea alata]|uniref:Transferase protein n=1 Tax=Dioscorea alata TaxID=55571 RepID=A0ACB7WTN8_DIOAL|nr:Transferase protein [Dioscorea alata]